MDTNLKSTEHPRRNTFAGLLSWVSLLLILCAALIARYGPEVMNIGRAGGQCGSAGRAEQFQREQGPQMGGMV